MFWAGLGLGGRGNGVRTAATYLPRSTEPPEWLLTRLAHTERRFSRRHAIPTRLRGLGYDARQVKVSGPDAFNYRLRPRARRRYRLLCRQLRDSYGHSPR